MQIQQILTRVQALLLKPKDTWEQIEKEPANLQDTYVNYVMPLAAIPAVTNFLGMSLIGIGPAGAHVRIPFLAGIIQAIVSFGLSLGMIYALAYIIDQLATNFGAARNFNQAFKVAAYAPTASWIVGLVFLIPALGFFALLGGLYSLYLLFVGLPILMKPQADKATTYTLAVIGCAIVLSLAIGIVMAVFFSPATLGS
ncbi:MAG: Yip1 family protein [Alphaproteobacteria bacterium]